MECPKLSQVNPHRDESESEWQKKNHNEQLHYTPNWGVELTKKKVSINNIIHFEVFIEVGVFFHFFRHFVPL